MARVSPINPAFPNDVVQPNLIVNGFNEQINELSRGDVDFYDLHGLSCSRSLIIALDQEVEKTIEKIDYGAWYTSLNAVPTDAPKRILSRLMVVRNIPLDNPSLAKIIIDPIYTDKTPGLTAVGVTGINWGAMLDWQNLDIVFNRYISQDGSDVIEFNREFSANERIHVILTPVYVLSITLPFQNSSVTPSVNVGCYAGSFGSGGLDSRQYRVPRTLSVTGKFC